MFQNRMARNMPTPMDVGYLHEGQDWPEETYDEIAAVGTGGGKSRFSCGQAGHFARECPHEKGKGPKCFGKGMGKAKGETSHGGGWSGGAGKGGSGPKGGFQGACFECGAWGHRAWECREVAGTHMVEEEGAGKEATTEVGGVWTIGMVESVSPGAKRVELGENRFKALMEDDDVDSDIRLFTTAVRGRGKKFNEDDFGRIAE